MRLVDWFNRELGRGGSGMLERVTVIDPPEPLEGTRMSIWNSILPGIYGEWDSGGPFSRASRPAKPLDHSYIAHSFSLMLALDSATVVQ
jgi:hypothetical protein